MFLQKFVRHIVRCRQYYTVSTNQLAKKDAEAYKVLTEQLQAYIKMKGPITVAEYMRNVLTSPLSGYYMHNDVFGKSGDFVTSPELGQLFGEMVAIWFLNEWKKIGSPKPFQIVELGPGRGSLCSDMLRVFKHFNELENCSIHLIEVSPFLRDIQARKLCLSSETVETNSENKFCHRFVNILCIL